MTEKIKPWFGSIALIPLIIFLIINNGKFIFLLDHFNLLIHEGGHGIFKLFGKFVYTLGGSLMQLFIPALFVFYFYTNQKIFGTQISLILLGENLLNVGRYAADARKQLLPLLGGNKVYHDWHYLLSNIGILNYDKIIGYFFTTLAVITFLITIAVPLLLNRYKEAKININI